MSNVILDDTIIAQASPVGSGKRGILRLSGTMAVVALNSIFVPETDDCTQTKRGIIHDILHDNVNDTVNDTNRIIHGRLFPWGIGQESVPCMLVYWKSGSGYTGQPSVELHTLGSQPLLVAILRVICATGIVRLAQPGEFSLRAFLAGRIDLTQAEAVYGVIHATDTASLKIALSQLAGGVRQPLWDIRQQLLEAVAHVEASLDFADEDVEFIDSETLDHILKTVADHLQQIQRQMNTRAVSHRLPKVMLLGCPNTGKSSLYNTLSRHSLAIVADTAGTTRDYLETEIQVDDIRFYLVDTAGLMENENECEHENECEPNDEQQCIKYMECIEKIQPSVILLCVDARRPQLLDWEQHLLEMGAATAPQEERRIGAVPYTVMAISTLADLAEPDTCRFFPVSTYTGQGVDVLPQWIKDTLSQQTASDVMVSTSVRCHHSIQAALNFIHTARQLHRGDTTFGTFGLQDETLVAAEMRRALISIGEIVGEVYTEDILDSIFSHFCLGK